MSGYNFLYDGLAPAANSTNASKEDTEKKDKEAPKPALQAKSILKRREEPSGDSGDAKRAKTNGDDGRGGDGEVAGCMGLSAAQVANMMCEMYSSKGKMRCEHLSNVFAEKVKTFSLFTLEPIPAGTSKSSLISALEKLGAPKQPAEACARVFVECESSSGSMSLDVYAAGRSPGFSGTGIMEEHAEKEGGEEAEGVVVLYRVMNDVIDMIWVGEDVGNGMQKAGSKSTFIASPLWGHILGIIRANIKGGLTCHYSNYALEGTDTLGLGLGSVSAAETWQEEGGKEVDPSAPVKLSAKAKKEEVEKSILAFEKVAQHLENDKKFGKAVKVLLSMIDTNLMHETKAAAFAALKAAMGPAGYRAGDATCRKDCFTLMRVCLKRQKELVDDGSVEESLLQCWKLHSITTNGLLNDDSFAFAKTAKEVQTELENLGSSKFESNEEFIAHRAAALCICLQIFVSKYTFAWAKASVDMCFKILVDPKKRACFGKDKDKVEELISQQNKKKHVQGAKEGALDYQTAGFQHGRKGW